MMKLEIQLTTFLFSVGFGILFSFLIDLIKNKLFKIKTILQLLISFVLTISLSLLYFYILLKLNNAIIHPYYIVAFIIGFIIENSFKKVFKRIVLLFKRWYNFFGG